MTSVIAKYVSKKILGESLQNKFGTEDPYFEQVPATRLNGRPSSKIKKRRKALPAGISEHDGKILTKVKRRAYRLDNSLFNCCGIRFGWSSVIGIIPVIGDFLDAFMAMMVFRTCQQIEGGLPADVKAKMMFNIVLDFGIGLVPFLGDIADAIFRANTRNAVELEKHLRMKGAAILKAQGQRLPLVDPSDPVEYDNHMNEMLGPPPGYIATTASPQSTTQQLGYGTNSPAQTNIPEDRSMGSWFSRFGSKKKHADVETGVAQQRLEAPPPSLPVRPSQQNQSRTQKSRPV